MRKGSIASAQSLSLEEVFCEWLPYLGLMGAKHDFQFSRFLSELGSFKGHSSLSFFRENDDEQRLVEPEELHLYRSLNNPLFEQESKTFLQKLKRNREELVLGDDDIESL